NSFSTHVSRCPNGPVARPGYFRLSSNVIVAGRPLGRKELMTGYRAIFAEGKQKEFLKQAKELSRLSWERFASDVGGIQLQCYESYLSQSPSSTKLLTSSAIQHGLTRL